MSKDKAPSQSVARTLTVLETLVAADQGLTLTALAKETRIPLATCAAIVYTLEQRGYAARRVIGRSHFWRATLGLYGLAAQLVRKVDLATVAQEEMRALAEKVQMPVHIGVLNGASVVYIAKAATTSFIQFDTYPGKLAPYNLTALGKAIVAHYEPERLAPLLEQMVPGEGPGALPPGAEPFLRQLAEIRDLGYAVEMEEERADFACVAAPFFDAEDQVLGSVGVTGFKKDLSGELLDQVTAGIRDIASIISGKLGHVPRSR